MKKLLFTLLALPLILGSFTSSEDKGFNLGDKAPLTKLEMKDCNGGSLTLEKAVSKTGVVVIFSCNTCPFVVGGRDFKGWENQYNDLYAFAKENGMELILVNSNEAKRKDDDSAEEMRKHADAKEYKMRYLIDKNSELANAFGAKTTPHVFVLNSNLELVYKGAIDNSWDTKRDSDIEYLKPAIHGLVHSGEVLIPETAPKGCSIKRV